MSELFDVFTFFTANIFDKFTEDEGIGVRTNQSEYQSWSRRAPEDYLGYGKPEANRAGYGIHGGRTNYLIVHDLCMILVVANHLQEVQPPDEVGLNQIPAFALA